MSIANEKYVSLTTYRKDGSSSAVPVWIVDAGGGAAAFTTASTSLKARRLANNAAIKLQPCDMKGRVTDGTDAVSATATVSPADFDRVRALVKKKYGMAFHMINAMGRVSSMLGKGPMADAAIMIRLD